MVIKSKSKKRYKFNGMEAAALLLFIFTIILPFAEHYIVDVLPFAAVSNSDYDSRLRITSQGHIDSCSMCSDNTSPSPLQVCHFYVFSLIVPAAIFCLLKIPDNTIFYEQTLNRGPPYLSQII